MSDLADTIWLEFEAETDEHLGIIETLLLQASDGFSSDGIAQLFRSFHSIKGLARAMGLAGMESTTHISENILGIVRDGKATLTAECVDVLLKTLDGLAEMRDYALVKHTSIDAPPALIESLEGAFAAAGGAVENADDAAQDDDEDDGDEMLTFFAESMCENMPYLAHALSANMDEAAREDLEGAVESLAYGAEVMEFDQLKENLEQLVEALPSAEAPSDKVSEEIVTLLSEIHSQAEVIADVAGQDTGAAYLAKELAKVASGENETVADEMQSAFEDMTSAIEKAPGDTSLPAISTFFETSRSARGRLQKMGADGAVNIMFFVEDAFQRIGSGEVMLSPALLETTASYIEALSLASANSASEDGSWDIDPAGVEELVQNFRSALEVKEGRAADDEAEGETLHGGIEVHKEFMKLLTPQQMDEIAVELENKQNLYTVLVFLEQDSEAAGPFIKWLQSSVKAVTNRTIIRELTSGLEFLILSDITPEEIKKQLAGIDPAGTCIVRAAHLSSSGETLLIDPQAKAAPVAGYVPAAKCSTVVRVRSEVIETMMNQIGEMMVLAHSIKTISLNAGAEKMHEAMEKAAQDLEEEKRLTLQSQVSEIRDAQGHIDTLHHKMINSIQHLYESALDLHVVPLETTLNRITRIAKDLAQAQGKRLQIEVEGREVRIDKSIVDLLGDPLMHIVRNAIDHGVETSEERAAAGKPEIATFRLLAAQRGNEVVIEISDDGRGLNLKRIKEKALENNIIDEAASEKMPEDELMRLIFMPGFSTAQEVTETSGRGVGMDVVLSTVKRLGGDISIDSEAGVGSKFSIRLPISAALQMALLVADGDQIYAIPERHISEICESGTSDIQNINGHCGMFLRNIFLPIFPLRTLLNNPDVDNAPSTDSTILVLSNGEFRIGIEIDRTVGRQEIFLKEIHPQLASIPGIGGATVLGDGKVVIVLEIEGLFSRAQGIADEPQAEDPVT